MAQNGYSNLRNKLKLKVFGEFIMATEYTPPPMTTSGNSDQYIMNPPTQQELESIAEVKMQYGNPSSTVGVVIDPEDALTKNAIWMAKKMKQRLPHVGFVENAIGTDIPQSTQEFPGYINNPPYETAYPDEEYVTEDDPEYKYITGTDWRYISGEAVKVKPRDVLTDKYAATDDGYNVPADDNYGTFKTEVVNADEYTKDGETYVPPYNRKRTNIVFTENTPTSGEDGLINPIPGLAADNVMDRETKTHYRRGEVEYDGVTKDNFLDRPGIEVNTADTWIAIQEAEEEGD